MSELDVNKSSIKLEKEKKPNKETNTSIKDKQPQLKADKIITESIESPDSEHISFQAEHNLQSRKDKTS